MKPVPTMPAELKAPKKKYDDYEVKDAADTLMRAEEVKQNPHLMKHVHKHLGKKKKAIRSIQDLKDKAAELDQEELAEKE
jgi:hypothetical protein